MTIRPLEIDDFSAFLNIQRDALLNAPEVFGSDYDWFDALSILSKEQRYEKYMNFPYQYLLGAIDEKGAIVGMIGFSSEHMQAKTRHKGKIWGMYVTPEQRGKGLASQLVQTVLSAAQDIGCEQIQLSVSTRNTASYSLYLRIGFTVYGTESHAMKIGDEYVDEYLMVKFFR
jgi:RimJ/RimL family protein N-acetyltransferase